VRRGTRHQVLQVERRATNPELPQTPEEDELLEQAGADHGIELLTVAPAKASSRAPDLEEEKPNTPYDSVVREQ